MEYQVPQFIEVEDKLVGPLTLRQFIYVAGGAGLCVVFFAYLPVVVAVILSALVGGFAAALAFYRVNGKPFLEVLEAGFNYYVRAKLFLWKHQDPTAPEAQSAHREEPIAPRGSPKLTRGKLSELAWSLDVKTAGGDVANRES